MADDSILGSLTDKLAAKQDEYFDNQKKLFGLGEYAQNPVSDEEKQAIANQTGSNLALGTIGKPSVLNDNFSILTAENPYAKQLSSADNAKLMSKLYNELSEKGIDFQKVNGSYNGTKENSVLIPHSSNSTPFQLSQLAKKYGQESIIHKINDSNILENVTGSNMGKIYEGQGINFDPNQQENFSSLGNNKFSLNVDFNTPKSSRLVHYSNSPSLQEIDPSFHGDSGLEKLRTNRPDRTYYYREGTPPESIVSQRAKSVHYIDTPQNLIDLNSKEAIPYYSQAQKLAEKSGDLSTELENILKKQGYEGYYNTGSTMPESVAIFTKQKPIKSLPFENKTYADGGEVTGNINDSVFDQFLQPSIQENQPTQALVGKVPNPTEPLQAGDDSVFDPFIQPELKAAKYDNTADMAKAFAIGAGQGAIGPLAPMAARAAGANPETYREIQEAHPYIAGAGELAGLVGTGIYGKGLGAVLGAVGKIAEVGEGASTVAKIGSKTAQAALENVAFQSSDELSKLVLNDPNQSVGSAAANLGAAGIIGGVFGLGAGGANALWEVGKGAGVSKVLKTLVSKAGGIDGEALDNATQTALNRSGLEFEPELKAALSSDPIFNDMFNTLRQTDTTKAGREIQKTYNDARQRAADAMVESTGRDPAEVENLGDFSKYEAGKELGNSIADAYQKQVEPIAAKFQEYREKYGKTELQPDVTLPTGDTIPGAMSQVVDKISQLALDEGWTTSPSSDIMREVNRVVKELPLQSTVKDLTSYISQIGQNTWDVMNPGLIRAGRLMKNIAKEAEAGALVNKIGITQGAEAVQDFSLAKSAYSQQSSLKDALNDRLHIKGANTSNFASSLREMAKTDGESVYNRLSGKTDADLLSFLSQNYPQAANILRKQHLDQILKKAVDKAAPNMTINGEQIARGIKQLSPELQSFVLPKESLGRIDAINQMMEKFNQSPYNFSNTARTFDKMIEYVPSTVTGMIAALATGNPIMGAAIGALTKYIGKEVPDAAKLALLKFMGSAKPISATGFKSAAEFIANVQKGEKILTNGAKRVFNLASDTAIGGPKPTSFAYQKLDKLVQNAQNNPDELTQNSDSIGHYMPEHGEAFAAQSARIVSYLSTQKPGTDVQAPLDSKMPVPPIKQTQYERTLALALNPVSLLDKVKDGSVTPKDLIDVKSMYPDLYSNMINKISNEMSTIKSKGLQVPYRTRIGISLMMGQPMDSTMTPAAIQVANPLPPPIQPQMPQGSSKPRSKGVPSSPALQKLSKAYRTPNEARQARMQGEK